MRLFEFNRQHRESLVDVVVKFSADLRTFFLLRFDQFPRHLSQSLFRLLALSHVNSNADVTSEEAISIKSGYSNVEHQPIFSIRSWEPILHPKFLLPVEGRRVRVEAADSRLGRLLPPSRSYGVEDRLDWAAFGAAAGE